MRLHGSRRLANGHSMHIFSIAIPSATCMHYIAGVVLNTYLIINKLKCYVDGLFLLWSVHDIGLGESGMKTIIIFNNNTLYYLHDEIYKTNVNYI